ncbi:Lrp/AsnC family transcriptional regulator [Candidatus Bathyarchaeota archaeon]|nr:Lrp/AsnC family transcriptional regulator [Candidatus Bathyarchaeota archaeon]
MTKKKLIDLLYELMKDSKRSDRELAKVVKVSQPTITRMRRTLEKSGYIREYTVIPAFEKLGFEILALNFVEADLTSEFHEWLNKNSKIVFACYGEGSHGRTILLASIHENFTDYAEFANELKKQFDSKSASFTNFLSSLNVDTVKPFSLKGLKRSE